MQVQPLRGPDDRSLLIEVDRERPDGDVGAGRAEAGGGGKALTGWQNLLAQLNVKALSLPVRQAILYAIDYNGIVAALRGAGVLSSGIVPPGMFGHFNDLPAYSYDQARAAALLKSAGYGPGGRR